MWVPIRAVVAIHDRQIARHGGRPGLRDMALLEAGCARALNLHACGQPLLAEVAAAYGFNIAKAHAFRRQPVEGVRVMEALASGATTEAAFAAWLADGIRSLT